MAPLTPSQLDLLQQLSENNGWLILPSEARHKYEVLEKGGYVGIEHINPSKVYCQITAKGRARVTQA